MDNSLWRTIVENVQPYIPSIEPASSSEDEGSIEIFQRPTGLSLQLPDDTRDTIAPPFVEEPLDVSEPENIAELNKSPDTALNSSEKSLSNHIVLSFALEHLDLNVFQNTQKVIKPQRGTAEIGDGYPDGGKENYYKNILEKIASFCEKQSVKSHHNPNYVKKNYMGPIPEENMVEEIKERPTVYIDLRCTSQTSTKPIKSPSQCSVHKEAVPAKSPSQVHAGTQTSYWKETGKSMLLRKIRENNQRNKCMNKTGVKKKRVCVKTLDFMEATNKDYCESQQEGTDHSCVEFEHAKPKTENLKNNQELSKKQRDHYHKQCQHTVKELEKCRPTKSVGQKQPAAENTDLLYDIDASHLEPVRTLPTDRGNAGHVLLIVNLSSLGMVTKKERRIRRRKINSDFTNLYNTLVTWLLSLVGPHSPSAIEANANVPFWVVGLQQLWTKRGLSLYVLAVAKQTYTQRKKDTDIPTPFHNHISRFLFETSLPTIAHWVPQLNTIMGEDIYNAPIYLPSCNLSSFITVTSNKEVIGRIFELSPGFYWQTLETPGHKCKGRETIQDLHTEISITLGHKDFYQHPLLAHYTLQAILVSGLDICGLRLLYPSPESLPDHFGCKTFLQKGSDNGHILVMAVRGPYAHSISQGINRTVQHMFWQKTVGAEDGEADSLLLYTPQQQVQIHKELCLWFSGRLEKYQNESLKSEVQVIENSTSFLCATTKADILLVVSPLIPPCCYGQVLSTCEHRGFILSALQIMKLDNDRTSLLGLTSQQAQIFCTSQKCLVLILKKENALHHTISLLLALMKEFKSHNLLTFLPSRGDVVQIVEPSLCFHTTSYSNNMFNIFVEPAWAVPDPSTVVLSSQKCPLDLEEDEVVVFNLCGQDMGQGLSLLHRTLTQHGFQLLALKWLPALSRLQALEVSPYEVGEKHSHNALVTLMSGPALVCALRRNNALLALRKLLLMESNGDLGILMSPTPEVTARQCALFFFEHELISCAVKK
ncbi:dynein axonemal assembly factor 8 isoform X2 [Boleophthalmus pectinirostris]|uniref:dynein axonemal assembly factor 8 isoform X2 n=1 Tax=Boleophthalmus pectinirostris TaxID=150288 RepID=UPI0024309459|nr:dynein axonemal assembly factor 8 isoform X2 [Boleophthalmus pectinirostris]